jgi:drug/metabolite transporter (DMT)-like permease
MKILKTYLSPILATICWAFSYIWTNMAFVSFHPVTIVTLRVLFASIFMIGLAFFTHNLQKIQVKHLLWFLGLGLLEPFGYFLCEIYGLTMVSPTFAAVILSTIPLFSPFIAFVFLREKITWANILGIVISMAGVLAISIGGNGSFITKPLGVILLFCAVFISISYSVSIRKLSKYYSVTTIVTYQNITGVILFTPVFFIMDYGRNTLPFEPKAMVAIVLLAIFASALAFIFYASSLNRFGVTRTNIFLNLLPAITAVLSVTMLGEQISIQKIWGLAIVILGLFVGQSNLSLAKKKMSS